jgi:hypothetical protein
VLGQRLHGESRVFQLAEPRSASMRGVAVEPVQGIDHLLDLLPRHVLELDAGQRRHEHVGQLRLLSVMVAITAASCSVTSL